MGIRLYIPMKIRRNKGAVVMHRPRLGHGEISVIQQARSRGDRDNVFFPYERNI
jgi:hypothetical protein